MSGTYFPQHYFIKRFETQDNQQSEDLARCLLESHTLAHQTVLKRIQALGFGLLVTGEGNLVGPDRVTWTATSGIYRFRLRGARLRLYSWISSDLQYSVIEKISLNDGDIEMQEQPLMCFTGPPLFVDQDVISSALLVQNIIWKGGAFEISEYNQLVKMFMRGRDPSFDERTRVLNLLTVFEYCFGATSGTALSRTRRRLSFLLEGTGGEDVADFVINLEPTFRELRNSIAHGRPSLMVDQPGQNGFYSVIANLELAVAVFLTKFATLLGGSDKLCGKNFPGFSKVKSIVLGET